MTSSEMLTRLAAPFPPDRISWRAGSFTKDKSKARALAYLDARDVMQRLDQVCGPANWQNRYSPMPNGTTCCEIDIRVDGEWITKSNGAGDTDIEAAKGAYSDAFKRAAVLWGVGQYLYDIDSPWVVLNQFKQIDPSEQPRLRAILAKFGGSSSSSVNDSPRHSATDLGGPPDAGGKPPATKDAAYERERIVQLMNDATTKEDLGNTWKTEQAIITKFPASWQKEITKIKDQLKAALPHTEDTQQDAAA